MSRLGGGVGWKRGIYLHHNKRVEPLVGVQHPDGHRSHCHRMDTRDNSIRKRVLTKVS